jgi:hypothetical protein
MGSGCIDPNFLDLGTSWRWMVGFNPRPLYPRGKASVTHWMGGSVDPRAGPDDVEKRKFLTLPGLELRPLGRPACNQSLYRLRNWYYDNCSVVSRQIYRSVTILNWISICNWYRPQKWSSPKQLIEEQSVPRPTRNTFHRSSTVQLRMPHYTHLTF